MKVLDLFSGIGGFSLGLERAGMETVAFCEIDKHCREVLKKHWPNVPIFDDVTKLQNWPKVLGVKPDLLCGGFPCQDISVAGKQRGINADRSGLWKEFHRLIKKISPRWVIIENVANLRNQGLARVLKDLWKIGYACEWHIISARSVGACHLRERIWIIAYPNSETFRNEGEELSDKIRSSSNARTKGLQSKNREAQDMESGASNLVAANPDLPRFWKSFASEEEKSLWWSEATASFRDWWKVESGICRMDDGLPKGMDRIRRERIKMLGNSVVPQIVELIGKQIMKYEENL